jgi:precorrin-2 methylase
MNSEEPNIHDLMVAMVSRMPGLEAIAFSSNTHVAIKVGGDELFLLLIDNNKKQMTLRDPNWGDTIAIMKFGDPEENIEGRMLVVIADRLASRAHKISEKAKALEKVVEELRERCKHI